MVNNNDNSLFTHGYVNDIFITVGSERYPYSDLCCNFPNNKYGMVYQMYRQFCKKIGVSPSLDGIDFRDTHTIYCFDLSARPTVFSSKICVQLNVFRNPLIPLIQ